MTAPNTFTLADFDNDPTLRLRIDLSAPLPLGYTEALRRGLALRNMGTNWTYAVIAVVMAEYHGFNRSSAWWRSELRATGALPRHRGASWGLPA